MPNQKWLFASSRSSGFLFLAAMAFVMPPVKAGEVYKIDAPHTEVRVVWNHLGLSNQSARFLKVEGTLDFDQAAPEKSTLEVTIAANSLTSDVPALDKKLHGKDFFDVEKHPHITFKSTKVLRTGAKIGQVTGDLTIRGKTVPVTMGVTLNFSGDHPLAIALEKYKGAKAVGFSAETQFLRSAFGLGKFAPLTSDAVEVKIEAELIQKP